MPHFNVYTIPGSPYARSVLAALIEKGAEFKVMALAPGEHKREPHLSRHPFGRMPVLEHDGFLLYEAQAILRYLDRLLPAPPLTPTEVRAAARMDQLLNICDWYLFQGVANVIGFQRIVGPKLAALVPDEAIIAAAMPRAHAVMAELSRLLGEHRYLTGEQMTLADLLTGAIMDFMIQTPEWSALSAGRANLAGWLARLNTRESFQSTTWERVERLAKAA